LCETKITFFFHLTHLRQSVNLTPPSTRPLASIPSLPKTAERSHLLWYKCSSQTHIIKFTSALPSHDMIDSWGHMLPTIAPLTIFRLILQNPNGLHLHINDLALLQEFCHSKEYVSAVLCLPETNVNWNAPYQLSDFTSLLRSTWKTFTAIVSRYPETSTRRHRNHPM